MRPADGTVAAARPDPRSPTQPPLTFAPRLHRAPLCTMRRSFVLALLAALLLAAPATAADPRRGEQWNLDLIQSDAAHAVSTGAGAVVAVVDSGVQADHPDLAGPGGQGYDLVPRDAPPGGGHGHRKPVGG